MINQPDPTLKYHYGKPANAQQCTNILHSSAVYPFNYDSSTKKFFNRVLWGVNVCVEGSLVYGFFYLNSTYSISGLGDFWVYFWNRVTQEWVNCNTSNAEVHTAYWCFPNVLYDIAPVILPQETPYNPNYSLTQADLGIDMKEALKTLGNIDLAEAVVEEFRKVNILNRGELKLFLKATLSPDSYGPVVDGLEKIYERNEKNDISRTDGY